MKKMRLLPLIALCLSAACAGDIGDECDKSGAQSECVDEAICTSTASGKVCLKRCTDDAQCRATEACNGVAGTSIKSCQPK